MSRVDVSPGCLSFLCVGRSSKSADAVSGASPAKPVSIIGAKDVRSADARFARFKGYLFRIGAKIRSVVAQIPCGFRRARANKDAPVTFAASASVIGGEGGRRAETSVSFQVVTSESNESSEPLGDNSEAERRAENLTADHPLSGGGAAVPPDLREVPRLPVLRSTAVPNRAAVPPDLREVRRLPALRSAPAPNRAAVPEDMFREIATLIDYHPEAENRAESLTADPLSGAPAAVPPVERDVTLPGTPPAQQAFPASPIVDPSAGAFGITNAHSASERKVTTVDEIKATVRKSGTEIAAAALGGKGGEKLEALFKSLLENRTVCGQIELPSQFADLCQKFDLFKRLSDIGTSLAQLKLTGTFDINKYSPENLEILMSLEADASALKVSGKVTDSSRLVALCGQLSVLTGSQGARSPRIEGVSLELDKGCEPSTLSHVTKLLNLGVNLKKLVVNLSDDDLIPYQAFGTVVGQVASSNGKSSLRSSSVEASWGLAEGNAAALIGACQAGAEVKIVGRVDLNKKNRLTLLQQLESNGAKLNVTFVCSSQDPTERAALEKMLGQWPKPKSFFGSTLDVKKALQAVQAAGKSR
jgi:hypothetical protein